jgi:predicted dehydrogenase
MRETVRVGVLGSGFISNLHALSINSFVHDAEVIAVASPTAGHAQRFAREHDIPNAFQSYADLLAMEEIDMVTLGVPNDLHCQITVDAARAGKHVVCEKPLCRTLQEADQMLQACREAGVFLFYAEQLLFAPKYVRAKQLIEEGALGDVFLVKHREEHYGPHAPWFWDTDRAGGGVLLDMGCHSIEYTRWLLDKPQVQNVTARMGRYVHTDKTEGEDFSLCVVEYDGGAVAIAENSWGASGGVHDRCEIFGSRGNTRGDLLRESALLTHSDVGYGYALEKSEGTKGWTFTVFEEAWNFGYPQEMQHFVDCVLGKVDPIETGNDGREVLEIIYAAYQSAHEGRTITWPYDPPLVDKPIDLWGGQSQTG